ncbi:low-specificity L-threonine aldolase [Aquisalibacillus elongatus]|uniref:L-threonine aldolase n=1 Tax=Aquisalibacillus elongatus TaxID=485577 RepID=A0A3N5B1D4_9BACI|nr:low-specificity L-threonine aldolase [Aquisalibacillus elongatus]RPF51077.1 L-threonine aldolase [Aquisalibacillus elongatus]
MIDLRSDTVTKPTKEMRQAAFEAEVGDDVYGEDPSVNQLEALAAEKLGKEAALFVTSGTQGNQLAVLAHCKPSDEVIMEDNAHVFVYEGAAMSALAGIQPRTIKGERGAMNPEEVEAAIRPEDIHFPETGLICLENTHNKAGGTILPLENMKEIKDIAQKHQIPVHLDGARLFNASVATGIPVHEYAAYTDTVQFCLSKGLGAPVGSILAGPKEFIDRARKWRKRLGGGLRQAGMVAAPGIYALNHMIDRLAEDHYNAKVLAEGLGDISGIEVEGQVETNMVLLNVKNLGLTSEQFIQKLESQGVLAVPYGPYTIRFVTHNGISQEDVQTALSKIQQAI